MKSDLDLLIEYYEDEKLALSSSIKNYLLENDYLYAHYQQEELWRLDRQLSMLYYLKDPLYLKRQELERLKEVVNRYQDEDRLKLIYERRVTEKENDIKRSQSESLYFNDTQVIDDALFNLYEGKFKKFKLCLNKASDLDIYFEMNVDDFLCISIDSQAVLEMYGYDKDNYDNEDTEREFFTLKKMGFEQMGESEWIVYYFNMNGFKDATVIKMLLSRIAYDAFGLIQGSRYLQTTIEYIS